VAGALASAGIDLTVCDVRPEATEAFAGRAAVAADPAQLAARSDVVIIAVVNDEQVLDVVGDPAAHPAGGVLGGARPGTTVVVLSTVSPRTVQRVGELARSRGVGVLDCGVSGGPAAAAEGKLVAMVGGDEAVIDRVRPVLDGFCSSVVRMGPLGAGLQAKLARNLVQYGSWLAAYEGQVLAEAAGVELAKLAEVIRSSDQLIGGASTLMFRRSVSPFTDADDEGLVKAMAAAAVLAHKDLRAALDQAAALGVRLPLAAMAEARVDAMFGVGPDVEEPGA